MPLEARFIMNAGQQDYTPAVARTAGKIIQLDDGRAAMVKDTLAADEKGSVYTAGILDVASDTSTTFSAGDEVFWDASASQAVPAGSAGPGDHRLGTAVAAKTSGQLVVRVDLNTPVGVGVVTMAATGAQTLEADLVANHERLLVLVPNTAALAITLPTADAGNRGHTIQVIKTSADAQAITLTGANPATADLDAQYDSATLVSTGAVWVKVASRIA